MRYLTIPRFLGHHVYLYFQSKNFTVQIRQSFKYIYNI